MKIFGTSSEGKGVVISLPAALLIDTIVMAINPKKRGRNERTIKRLPGG